MDFLEKATNLFFRDRDRHSTTPSSRPLSQNTDDDEQTDTEDDSGIADESECSSSLIPDKLFHHLNENCDTTTTDGESTLHNFFSYW